MSGSEAVKFEMLGDHVALVTLNRPDQRNAINGAVTAGLRDILVETERRSDIWVVILTGSGDRVFCAGADLKTIAAGRAADLMDPEFGFAGFVNAVRTKPWIAAVNGLAMAGGCELALACDMIVASDDAAFALPEVKRGLIAAAGGLFRLPRRLPPAIAMEMIATATPLPVARAHAFGMVNRVVAKADLLASARDLAGQICANAPIAVRESLAIARLAQDRDERQLDRLSQEAQAHVMQTEDFREGPLAFIEKRPPVWSGR